MIKKFKNLYMIFLFNITYKLIFIVKKKIKYNLIPNNIYYTKYKILYYILYNEEIKYIQRV